LKIIAALEEPPVITKSLTLPDYVDGGRQFKIN
jgi:hypothetical protein